MNNNQENNEDTKSNLPESKNHIVRKTVFLLISRILISEMCILFAYVGFRILINFISNNNLFYLEIPSNFIGFMAVSLLTLTQTLIIIYISFRWATEYYEIRNGEIVYHSGILTKKNQEYSIKGLQSIELHESILGKLFRFGTVKSFSPALQKELLFEEVHDPEEFVHLLKKAAGDNSLGILIRRR